MTASGIASNPVQGAAPADRGTQRRRRLRRGRLTKIIASVAAIIVALVWGFPIYWMLSMSLQSSNAIAMGDADFVPTAPSFDAFRGILADPSFWNSLSMSLRVSLLAVGASLVAAVLGAVALSRFRFRGWRAMLVGVLVVQMIPAEALFISQYRMLDGWNLLNTVVGLSVLYVGLVLPFVIWMLKGFIDGIPVELEEAAMVDGCGRMGAIVRVTLPLIGPGLVSTGVYGFLVAWNEYTLALVVLSSGTSPTLPIWLQTFQAGLRGTDWAGVMAGSVLIAVPVIVLFSLVQRSMARGMVAGAVKG